VLGEHHDIVAEHGDVAVAPDRDWRQPVTGRPSAVDNAEGNEHRECRP
jgi:hypothetical protein